MVKFNNRWRVTVYTDNNLIQFSSFEISKIPNESSKFLRPVLKGTDIQPSKMKHMNWWSLELVESHCEVSNRLLAFESIGHDVLLRGFTVYFKN